MCRKRLRSSQPVVVVPSGFCATSLLWRYNRARYGMKQKVGNASQGNRARIVRFVIDAAASCVLVSNGVSDQPKIEFKEFLPFIQFFLRL